MCHGDCSSTNGVLGYTLTVQSSVYPGTLALSALPVLESGWAPCGLRRALPPPRAWLAPLNCFLCSYCAAKHLEQRAERFLFEFRSQLAGERFRSLLPIHPCSANASIPLTACSSAVALRGTKPTAAGLLTWVFLCLCVHCAALSPTEFAHNRAAVMEERAIKAKTMCAPLAAFRCLSVCCVAGVPFCPRAASRSLWTLLCASIRCTAPALPNGVCCTGRRTCLCAADTASLPCSGLLLCIQVAAVRQVLARDHAAALRIRHRGPVRNATPFPQPEPVPPQLPPFCRMTVLPRISGSCARVIVGWVVSPFLVFSCIHECVAVWWRGGIAQRGRGDALCHAGGRRGLLRRIHPVSSVTLARSRP